MKTLIAFALLLTFATVEIKIEAATYSGAEKNKVDLFIKNNLLKITRNLSASSEVTVPKLAGYELQQVAVIEEIDKSCINDFGYVAVYKNTTSDELKVILYNAQNKEELVIDAVAAVRFEKEKENSRISMNRTGPDGEVTPAALLVPGHIQVAHKG